MAMKTIVCWSYAYTNYLKNYDNDLPSQYLFPIFQFHVIMCYLFYSKQITNFVLALSSSMTYEISKYFTYVLSMKVL